MIGAWFLAQHAWYSPHHSLRLASAKVVKSAETMDESIALLRHTARLSDSNTVVLTSGTYGFRRWILNWACNMMEKDIKNFVVAPLDVKLWNLLKEAGVPSLAPAHVISSVDEIVIDGDLYWDGPNYISVSALKHCFTLSPVFAVFCIRSLCLHSFVL